MLNHFFNYPEERNETQRHFRLIGTNLIFFLLGEHFISHRRAVLVLLCRSVGLHTLVTEIAVWTFERDFFYFLSSFSRKSLWHRKASFICFWFHQKKNFYQLRNRIFSRAGQRIEQEKAKQREREQTNSSKE